MFLVIGPLDCCAPRPLPRCAPHHSAQTSTGCEWAAFEWLGQLAGWHCDGHLRVKTTHSSLWLVAVALGHNPGIRKRKTDHREIWGHLCYFFSAVPGMGPIRQAVALYPLSARALWQLLFFGDMVSGGSQDSLKFAV